MIVSVRCTARRHEIVFGDVPSRVRVSAKYGMFAEHLFAATPDDVARQVGAAWRIPPEATPHINRIGVDWFAPLQAGDHVDFYEVRD